MINRWIKDNDKNDSNNRIIGVTCISLMKGYVDFFSTTFDTDQQDVLWVFSILKL